ncbi:MAG: hypothetical protein D6B25_01905 [Desulfobulbaceae bacterium]|nr:MAG: hypothetical protein D6B25_01905 [Desulfobulbaceae bacterium]
MSEIMVSDGRVGVIKAIDVTNVRQGLESIKNALIDYTTSEQVQESNLDTFLFVDLSPFNTISSSLVGILGSVIMDRKIQLLGLCAIQPTVLEVLTRFGVLTEDGTATDFASKEIKDNIGKVVAYDSIEQGLASLNPHKG